MCKFYGKIILIQLNLMDHLANCWMFKK